VKKSETVSGEKKPPQPVREQWDASHPTPLLPFPVSKSRDRLHAEHDYWVNLHTEMEIHQLHKKIDHLF